MNRTPLTPEHLQLLPTRRLEAAVLPDATSESGETLPPEMARLARYELRRRQCQVPVRNRYASVNVLSTAS